MKQAKALITLDGLLTINRIYTILYENIDPAKRPFYTVVDDRGVLCTYSADRFEIIHTPKGSPDFSEMQRIADEVKITQQLHGEKAIDVLRDKFGIEPICPVVQSYEERKETHGPFMVPNPDIKTSEDMASKPAMVVQHLKKCKNHAECGQPAEAERYEFCYDCWWAQDPRNKTIMQEYAENPKLDTTDYPDRYPQEEVNTENGLS